MEVIINVNKQMGGYTFGLIPESKWAIEEVYGVTTSPNIFVAYDVKTNFKQYHAAISKHIIPFMLGLDSEQLSKVTARLINVQTKEELLTQKYDEEK